MIQASLRQSTLFFYFVLLVHVFCKTDIHNSRVTRGHFNDMKLTVGDIKPGGCSKHMQWRDSSSSFDKDVLSNNLVLYMNVWDALATAAGSTQSVECQKFSNGVVAWTTAFDIKAAPGQENQVKSYSNIVWSGTPIKISALKAFAVTWRWSLQVIEKPLVMDVSLDIFLANTPGCRSQNCASREVMIWLAAIGGARPSGKKTSEAPIKIGGCLFDVWQGNVNVPVVSLIPSDDKQKFSDFSGNLKEAMAALIPYGVSKDEYIFSVGAGPEIFTGNAILETKSYSLKIT